jgi:hypothetical protein
MTIHALPPIFYPTSQLAHVLGNGKPSTLLQVERSMWRALTRMATGSTAEDEIEILLKEWRVMHDAWRSNEQGGIDFSFFDIRMFLSFRVTLLLFTAVCKFLLWSMIWPMVNKQRCLR